MKLVFLAATPAYWRSTSVPVTVGLPTAGGAAAVGEEVAGEEVP
jgi:hypothetical protein